MNRQMRYVLTGVFDIREYDSYGYGADNGSGHRRSKFFTSYRLVATPDIGDGFGGGCVYKRRLPFAMIEFEIARVHD